MPFRLPPTIIPFPGDPFDQRSEVNCVSCTEHFMVLSRGDKIWPYQNPHSVCVCARVCVCACVCVLSNLLSESSLFSYGH